MPKQRLISGVFSLAVSLVLGIVLAWQALPVLHLSGSQPEWLTIAVFQGSGSKDTAGFLTFVPWRLTWSCDPASSLLHKYNIIVELRTDITTTHAVDTVAFNTFCDTAHTSGLLDETLVGTIYLSVISEGEWTLEAQVKR
jgi:hypothetical protein